MLVRFQPAPLIAVAIGCSPPCVNIKGDMHRAIKIDDKLVIRIDAQCDEFHLGTRQNLTSTLIRKGLDFLETNGYEKLLKIPAGLNNGVGQDDRSGLKRKTIDEIVGDKK